MHVLCTLTSHGEARTLNGARGEVTAVDVVFKSGNESIIASAFDKTADRFLKDEFTKDSLLSVHLTFTVRQTNDGKTFQSCRVDDVAVIFDCSKAF